MPITSLGCMSVNSADDVGEIWMMSVRSLDCMSVGSFDDASEVLGLYVGEVLR